MYGNCCKTNVVGHPTHSLQINEHPNVFQLLIDIRYLRILQHFQEKYVLKLRHEIRKHKKNRKYV